MLKNMKVMGKLNLGFGIILVFLLTLGIISIQKMGVVNDQSTILAENWMPSIKVVEEINTNTSDLRIAEFQHVLSQKTEDMKKAEEAINSVLSTMKTNRAEYEKLISSAATAIILSSPSLLSIIRITPITFALTIQSG